MAEKYDFGGYATKNDLRCADGRVIKSGAFSGCNGTVVPLIWNHQHNDNRSVLGHALLIEREDGIYAYGKFNDTPNGQYAKAQLENGDLNSLSIYANNLQHRGNEVVHGNIREVSLVIAGANPGAKINEIMAHGADSEPSYEIDISYRDCDLEVDKLYEDDELYHSEDYDDYDDEDEYDDEDYDDKYDEEAYHSEEGGQTMEKTIGEALANLNDEEREAVASLVDACVDRALDAYDDETEDDYDDEDYDDEYDDYEEDEDEMQHNLFDDDGYYGSAYGGVELSHAEEQAIFADAMNGIAGGSLKQNVLAHGIEEIEYLFPDAKEVGPNAPKFIRRKMEWVNQVIGAAGHSPFARIRTTFADITADEARAKGYIKGDRKEEQVFSLLRRETTPQTVYKLQKIDRDDVIDINSFDVVAWMKAELRIMIEEEISRAILFGDGKLNSDRTHIKHDNVRPIFNDDDLFTIKAQVRVAPTATDEEVANEFISQMIRSRKLYRGSGNPTLFTTEDMLSAMLLIKDLNGRFIYTSESELAKTLRVAKIVTVPVMDGVKGVNGGDLLAIMVNMDDYKVGSDKGGAMSMFDDFDIDFNKLTYLMETRISGALVIPFAAIAFERSFH